MEFVSLYGKVCFNYEFQIKMNFNHKTESTYGLTITSAWNVFRLKLL